MGNAEHYHCHPSLRTFEFMRIKYGKGKDIED